MAEIKEQKTQGIMSQQEESKDTGFIARMIPDRNERRATGKLIGDALTSFSTMFGSTATQLGAMREEEEISDERQALAVQAAEQQIKVVGEENKKRAKKLEEITERKKLAEDNANVLFSQPMFKSAISKYIKETGITPDLSSVKVNLGRKWAKYVAIEGKDTATASIVNEIYNAKSNPKIELFSKYRVPFIKTTVDQQTDQALSKPKSFAESIVARKPENIPGQVASRVKLDPKVSESQIPETGEIFKVLDGSGAFRLERSVQNLIAANGGLVLTYPEGDRSTRAELSAEGGTGKENDIRMGTKAVELVRSMINSGYGEEDTDKLYRDVTLILQNASPKNKESITEQKDFEARVDQIKLELSGIDNRFDRRKKIEELKKGEGLPENKEPVVNIETLALTLLGASSDDEAPEYLINTHESNPNIEKVDDFTYNVIVKTNTDKYPAGTVVSIKIERGKVTSITDTKQKADVIPSTYEEWKALPEETTEQKQAKRRAMNIPAIRAAIEEENRRKRDER